MTFPQNARAYTIATGSVSVNNQHIDVRAPATTDILYRLGTEWINTVTNTVYALTSQTSLNNITSSTWTLLGAGAGNLNTLTGNTGGAISPSAGNINVVGAGALSFAGSGSTLTGTITSGGFTPNTTAGTTGALAVQNTYVATNASATTYTLPAAAAVGDVINIVGSPANTGGWVIAQNAGQTIHKEASASTTGVTGTATSAAHANESISIMCTVANTDFCILYSNGTVTLA